MNEKSIFRLISVFSILALVAALMPSGNALAPGTRDSEDLNVSIVVSSVTWIDISPDQVRWMNVQPGETSTTFTDLQTSTTGHEAIVVRNIGSDDIKTVWFNASSPASNPYGTSSLALYDVANFVLLSQADQDGNNTPASTSYYYINKKEFQEVRENTTAGVIAGRDVPYVIHNAPAAGNPNITHGRIRDGSNEYFWVVRSLNVGNCNYSDPGRGGDEPDFYLGILPHNETNVGDINLTSGCEVAGTCEEITNGWSTSGGDDKFRNFLDLAGTRFVGSVVSVEADCSGIELVTWNKDKAFDLVGTQANYWMANSTLHANFQQGTNLNEVLSPGEYYTGWLLLKLPFGVPAGTLTTGTITVLASATNP